MDVMLNLGGGGGGGGGSWQPVYTPVFSGWVIIAN